MQLLSSLQYVLSQPVSDQSHLFIVVYLESILGQWPSPEFPGHIPIIVINI